MLSMILYEEEQTVKNSNNYIRCVSQVSQGHPCNKIQILLYNSSNLFTCFLITKVNLSVLYFVNNLSGMYEISKNIQGEPGIETLLLRCKMSIEKCKGCIDMYYTTRNLAPEFLRNNNPKLPHMQNVHNIFYSVPLPKLTSDNYRIIFCKFCDNNPEKFDPTCILRYIGNVAEIRFYEDFCVGDLVICDLEGAKLEHVLKITPLLIAKAFFVYEKVYCSRFKGIYFFNCPLMGDKLIMILKSLMKPKLANRIHVVRTTKDFLENFDIKLLPKDYGGSQPSLETLRGILQEKFIQYQDRFDLLDTLEVDESLRPEKLKNDELLGFHGNFRQLNVD